MLYKLHFEYKIILSILLVAFINLLISFTDSAADYGTSKRLTNTTHLNSDSVLRLLPLNVATNKPALNAHNNHPAGNSSGKGTTSISRHVSPAKATLHTTVADDLPLL